MIVEHCLKMYGAYRIADGGYCVVTHVYVYDFSLDCIMLGGGMEVMYWLTSYMHQCCVVIITLSVCLSACL